MPKKTFLLYLGQDLALGATLAILGTTSGHAAEWMLKMNNANGCVVLKAGEATPGKEYYQDRASYPNIEQACQGAYNLTDFTSSSNRRCHHFDKASVERCQKAGVAGLPGT